MILFSEGEATVLAAAMVFGGDAPWLTALLMKVLPPALMIAAGGVLVAHGYNAFKIGGAEFGDMDLGGAEVGVSLGYARRLGDTGLSADISVASDVDFKEQVGRVGVNYSW